MSTLSRALLVLIVSLAASTLHTNAKADGKEYYLVGFSQMLFDGNDGLAAMNAECRATFDKNARMCTTEEVFRTPDLADLNLAANETAWVQSLAAGTGFNTDTRERLIVDQYVATLVVGGTLSCNSWSSTVSSFVGVTYNTTSGIGAFGNRSCASSNPVACCTIRKVSR